MKAEEIKGYIIEVFKNVRPENAPLRDSVNNAEAYYVQARDRQRDHREAHGCHRTEGTCYFDAGFPYQTAVTLHANSVRAYDAYICWLEYARQQDSYGRPPPPSTCQ